MIKKITAAFLIWLIGGWPTIVFALPQDGQIVGGAGSITEPNDTTMQINQNSQQMTINWQSFNIGSNEWVNFSQPNSSAIALNRVIGTDPSLLLGKLTANGQVFISNGSGVFFGPGSQVDVHGLIATTMQISDQDFLNGNYNFAQDPGNLSSVINEGNISATSYVGLLAPAVENRGTIVTASLGSIDLASGTAATMDFTGDGLIQFEVTEAVAGTVLDKDGNELKDRVSNTGLLQANGGQIRMSAKDAGDVIRHVVNMEGMIKANSVVEKDGKVFLMGGDSGVVNVSGTIDASGDDAGEKGGTVHVTGEYVGLFDDARVDVSGDAGGGTALIGGDYQGKNPTVQNAKRTYVGENAIIDASGGASGSGGKVIVWADEITRFYGSVFATGGVAGGDGGFAEVSGKGNLDFHANEIDLSAANGEDGTLLLDPLNITITTSADSNTAGFTVGSDQTEAFADDAGLTSNFDVTAGTGSFAGVTGTIELQATNDITVSAAWNLATSTGNSNVSVVLRAGNDININAAITLDGTGTLTLEADGNTANGVGDLVFGASGSIATGGGNVDITANDINLTSGSINASTGDVTLLISDAGTIGLGDANCGGTCGMQISGAEIQNITATNLTIGDSTNGQMTVENVTLANTANITGITTLNTTNTTVGGVIFGTTASTFTGALTVNAGQGITVGTNVTTGGFAIFDADSDDDGTGVFTIANSSSLDPGSNSLDITANDVDIQAGSAINNAGNVSIVDSQGGSIGLGDTTSNCGSSCSLAISGAELQNITAANLTLGNATTSVIYVDNVTAANSNNITGTVTLNATAAGGVVTFDTAASTFNTLSANAENGIQMDISLTTDTGAMTFNADSDSDGTGSLTFNSATTVSMTSATTLTSNRTLVTTASTVADFNSTSDLGDLTVSGGNLTG